MMSITLGVFLVISAIIYGIYYLSKKEEHFDDLGGRVVESFVAQNPWNGEDFKKQIRGKGNAFDGSWVKSNQAVAFEKTLNTASKVINATNLNPVDYPNCPNNDPKMNTHDELYNGFGYMGSVMSPGDYAMWLNIFRNDMNGNFLGISLYPKDAHNLQKLDTGELFSFSDLRKSKDGQYIFHPRPPNAQELFEMLDSNTNITGVLSQPLPTTNGDGYSPEDLSVGVTQKTSSPMSQHLSDMGVAGVLDSQKAILGGDDAKSLLVSQQVPDTEKQGVLRLEEMLPKMSNFTDVKNLNVEGWSKYDSYVYTPNTPYDYNTNNVDRSG